MPNDSQHASVSPVPEDRRQFHRQPVNSLGCIFLSGESGGVVLNVSEGGLTLYSTFNLTSDALESLRFQLPHSPEWIRARCEIAWVNETKKQVGIQFIELPDAARKQIREWVSSQNRSQVPAPRPVRERPRLTTMRTRATASPTGAVDELPAPVSKDSERLERKTRFRLAAHLPGGLLRYFKQDRLWWGFVAIVGLLGIASFVVGLTAGRGKSSAAGVSGEATASAPSSPDVSAETNASPAADATPRDAAPAVSTKPGPPAHVTVSSQLYVPVSHSPGYQGKMESLQIGRLAHRVDPEYPTEALARSVEGTVELRARIGADGIVRSVSAVGGPPLLAPAAVNAVRSWRYAPTLLSGKPVATEADIAIVFWLPSEAEKPRQ